MMSNAFGMAFVANNDTNTVLVSSSSDGLHWPGNTTTQQAGKTPPSLTLFKNKFWIAFVANSAGNEVLVCSSPDGVHWSSNTPIGQASQGAPSLAVFNNQLWIAFAANNASNSVLVCSSSDGLHWSNNTPIQQASKTPPSLAVFNNQLWVAFVANNSGDGVLVCSSSNRLHWSNNTQVGQASKTAPSLAAFNGRLWVAFVADNAGNAVLVSSSADGAHWTNNTQTGQASKAAPSLTAFNNQLWIAFVANNPSNTLLVCSSADGAHWSGNTNVQQSSKFAPSLAPELLTVGTARPLYKILTVVYAPPGTNGGKSSSQVDYGSGSSAGTSTSSSSSFKDGIDVSISAGFDVGPVSLGITGDFSTSKTTTDTASLDIKKSQNYDIKVAGPGADGINHDHDLFYLWLNPLLNLQIDAWGNVAWSQAVDGSTMNIQYVYAGQLKNPQTMPPGLQQQLNAAGLTPADYAQILATNPFAGNPQAAIDPNRYLPTGQSFPYQPPFSASDPVPTTTFVQQNSVTQTATRVTQTQYSVSLSVSAGIKTPFTASAKVTGSFQWTDTSSHGTSSTSTQSASVTVGGPAFGYAGPTDVLVYWDTLYNSFLFAFAGTQPSLVGRVVNASGSAATHAPVTLAAGGHVFKTFAGADGEYRIFGAPVGEAKASAGAEPVSVVVGSPQTAGPLRIGA